MGRRATYGRGHPSFLKYIKMIVQHPAYKDMPDVYLDNGEIQWEAPSNRPPGKFQQTHDRRLRWWRDRAKSVGIDPNKTPSWISRTAKQIHPTKKKPCKKCGRELEIGYAYPGATITRRLKTIRMVAESGLVVDPLEHITDLLFRLHATFGSAIFPFLPALLKSGRLKPPSLPPNIKAWVRWVTTDLIPSEPSILSPGVMSNAPDRLDGFHSFNRCCRHLADTGRSTTNLKSYATDRRAFEYWVDGDWTAADYLMGLIRSDRSLVREPCRNDHQGPCAADHVGPISLGFAHRPEFQLLCGPCNSSKNNRLTYEDVLYLRTLSAAGERVASWYCEELWKRVGRRVSSPDGASRLYRMMRDNRRTLMVVLGRIAEAGHYMFLCGLLELEYADRHIEHAEVRVEDHVVRLTNVHVSDRKTSYVQEQKARRVRVAFESMNEYLAKEARNGRIVTGPGTEEKVRQAVGALASVPASMRSLDVELAAALKGEREQDLRRLVEVVPKRGKEPIEFIQARRALREIMDEIGSELEREWHDPRYSRKSDD